MLKKTILLFLIAAILLIIQYGIAIAENTDFVTTGGRYFYLNWNKFYFNGANQYYLPFKSRVMVDEILQDAQQLGLNVIRTWGFADGVGMDGYCFQPQPGVYDENTFRNMDYVIYKANQLNIRLIIPLVNNWNEFGGMNKYVEWSNTAMAHDDFYTDEYCKNIYKNYLSYFLNRVNIYTGIAYKNDPTIMIWELANEPECESDKTGSRLYNWIEEMAYFIKSIDQNHLVSTGETGWYVNKGTDWMHNGSKGVDFIRNSQSHYIDTCSFHLYPQIYNINEFQAIGWINEHLDDAHLLVGKPVYLGEFGWRVPREIIGDFSQGPETWRVDEGYGASYPLRIESPSQNANGSILYFPADILKAYQYASGERWLNYPGFDFTPYPVITGWVYIPASAPHGMLAQIYTKSGNNWVWREGENYSLIPGEWNKLTFYTSNSYMPQQMMSVGIRIRNGATDYAGPVYYDSIIAFSDLFGEMIEDRNRVYNIWYENLNLKDADGAVLWILNGHQLDTTFFPDYDEYGVYYPEDTGTCATVKNYSNIVADKNSTILLDQPPSVVINSPTGGQTVSGTVTIRVTATDDKGISSVSYSIDSLAAQSTVYIGNNMWEGYWNSVNVSNGNHVISVSATDTAMQFSSAQVNVNVNNIIIIEKTIYIKNIDLSLSRKGKNGIKKQCFAEIYVLDNSGRPVVNASVYTHWSGLTMDSDVTLTNGNGIAKNISSNEVNATTGLFKITVDNVVKGGYRYTPALNIETSDQISF